MKRKIPVLILAIAAAFNAFAGDNLTELFQKALIEEEANHNFSEAIKLYQDFLKEYGPQRKTAATVVFRLGEVYRKLGKTNEAVVQYERVLREFGDEDVLAKLSAQNLSGLGMDRTNRLAAAGGPATNEEADEIQKIKAIIQNSPDLINAPVAGNTRLQLAATKGYVAVTEFLLKMGAKVDEKGTSGTPPLITAVGNGHKAVVELLLKNGADVNGRNTSGRTALFPAAQNGFMAVAEVLVKNGAAVSAVDSYGFTPLHEAAAEAREEMTKFLLDHGAKVNAQTTFGETPLHAFIINRKNTLDLDEAKILLEHGADPNLKGKGSPSPTDPAKPALGFVGNSTLAELLLDHGADPNLTDDAGGTLLISAIQGGNVNFKLAEVLLNHKANPDVLEPGMNRPLVFRALGQTELLKLLLDHGAKPNVKEKNSGNTPLHEAASYGQIEAITLLLQHKAEINATNDSGMTPLDLVVLSGRRSSVGYRIPGRVIAQPPFGNPPGAVPPVASSPREAPVSSATPSEVEKFLRDHGAKRGTFAASSSVSFSENVQPFSGNQQGSQLHWNADEKKTVMDALNAIIKQASLRNIEEIGWLRSGGTRLEVKANPDQDVLELFRENLKGIEPDFVEGDGVTLRMSGQQRPLPAVIRF